MSNVSGNVVGSKRRTHHTKTHKHTSITRRNHRKRPTKVEHTNIGRSKIAESNTLAKGFLGLPSLALHPIDALGMEPDRDLCGLMMYY